VGLGTNLAAEEGETSRRQAAAVKTHGTDCAGEAAEQDGEVCTEGRALESSFECS
jgi:hypothetical protein